MDQKNTGPSIAPVPSDHKPDQRRRSADLAGASSAPRRRVLSSDRDKIDFLLVQYFSHCAPSRLEDTDVDMAYVAQMLDPVLGSVDLTLPSWLHPLDDFIQAADACRSLNELLTSGTLEKGRKLKVSVGEDYFEPIAMVAFTRFSFLMRRVFFRLMHQDLNTILEGLRELEAQGVATLDCRSAQFSADEPVVRLRMICQSWKVMFHAEYSAGSPLRMLVDLRNVVDAALTRTGQEGRLARKRQVSRLLCELGPPLLAHSLLSPFQMPASLRLTSAPEGVR